MKFFSLARRGFFLFLVLLAISVFGFALFIGAVSLAIDLGLLPPLIPEGFS